MKNKIITTLAVTVALLTGCSDSNEPFTTEENESILIDHFIGNQVFSKNIPYYIENLEKVSKIKSLNEEYPIEITSVGGSKVQKDKAVGFYYDDYETVMRSCKIVLNRSDVKDTTSFLDRKNTFEITNQAVLDKIDNCISNYLQNTSIKSDELAYFLADDRIKKNIHYPFLSDSIKTATKDSKITYNEIFNIYRNLDKAIEKNLSTDLDKLNSDLKGELDKFNGELK